MHAQAKLHMWRLKDNFGSWFSSSTMWVQRTEFRPWAWQRMLLPAEPCHWPYYQFLKAYLCAVTHSIINTSLSVLGKYVTVFIVAHCIGNDVMFLGSESMAEYG